MRMCRKKSSGLAISPEDCKECISRSCRFPVSTRKLFCFPGAETAGSRFGKSNDFFYTEVGQ